VYNNKKDTQRRDVMRKMIDLIRKGAGKLALAGSASLMAVRTASAQGSGSFTVGGSNVPELVISPLSLPQLVSSIVNIILIVVGLIAVMYLIYGGITYVTAGGDAEKAGKGRTTITNAIIGIIIIAASLAIYRYVVGSI
jgi:threonine/homoserine/homoserine lactone efflux protein